MCEPGPRTDSAATLLVAPSTSTSTSLKPKWDEDNLPSAFRAPPPSPNPGLNLLPMFQSPASLASPDPVAAPKGRPGTGTLQGPLAAGPGQQPPRSSTQPAGHARKRSLSTFLHVNSPLLDEVEDRLLQLKWDAEEVAREVGLVAHLAGRLAWMLGFARQWIIQLFSLVAFATFLLPGFLSVGWEYYTSRLVKRGVRYGAKERNFADIFLPSPETPPPGASRNAQKDNVPMKRPIAVFFTGGAWIIGYRAWGALIGLSLARRGIICVVPDYRNYPQGHCGDMLRDVARALEWVACEAENLGGDKEDVHLVGQSAGAQLTACVLLDGLAKRLPEDVVRYGGIRLDPLDVEGGHEQANGDSVPAEPHHASGHPSSILVNHNHHPTHLPSFPAPRSYIGISGPYNLPLHGLKFLEKGLDRKLVLDIFQNDLRGYSPFHRAGALTKALRIRRQGNVQEQLEQLARTNTDLSNWTNIPILLLHGTADHSVPASSSTLFASSLQPIFKSVEVKLYKDKSHTDPIIEDPFEGVDEMGGDVVGFIRACCKGNSENGGKFDWKEEVGEGKGGVEGRRVPRVLVKWARYWNPF